MGAGNYTHTSRATGTVITQAIYDADHQNHIDNHNFPGLDDYSTDLTQQRLQTSPATLPTSGGGELERIRYALAKLGGTTYWSDIGGVVPAECRYVSFANPTTAATNVAGFMISVACIISLARMRLVTYGSSGDLIVDINKNGTSIWATTPANRLTLSAAGLVSQTSFDTTAVAAGDRITFDIDTVPAGTPSGVYVTLVFQPAAP